MPKQERYLQLTTNAQNPILTPLIKLFKRKENKRVFFNINPLKQ